MKMFITASTGLFLLLTAASCSKKEDICVQPHNENKMMTIMHEMDKKMDSMEMTKDIDHDFSTMMIMHHQTAIDMANELLESGRDTLLKRMAREMIDKQTEEINRFQVFLNGHRPHTMNEEQHLQLMMAMDKMAKQADLQLITGNVENDFASLMITHHQSAIDMAEIEAHYGHDTIPKEMAGRIKEDQKMEISMLQDWLLNHRNK